MSSARKITVDQALSRLAARCSTSECCEHDLRVSMSRWGMADDEADVVVSRLRGDGFIDDERYVGAFVNDKVRLDGWGRIKISHALRLKGFADNVIDNALATIDNADYERTLRVLLAHRAREVHGREPRLKRAALLRAGASRGYEVSLVSRFVNELLNDNGDCDDVDCC